jgi:hypothetical protein
MSCVMCESDAVQLRSAVDVLVVPCSVRRLLRTLYVHLLVCYLNNATDLSKIPLGAFHEMLPCNYRFHLLIHKKQM